MDEQNQTIKKLIEDFLNKLCVSFDEVSFSNNLDFQGGTRFLIETNESGILIGSEGATIYAINHLIKKMVWKKINPVRDKKLGTSVISNGVNSKTDIDKRVDFFVDINNYQKENIERIKAQAIDSAEKVALFKRDVEMPPMSSYERMVVHSVLADNPNVLTESIGENDFRRLVIKTK